MITAPKVKANADPICKTLSEFPICGNYSLTVSQAATDTMPFAVNRKGVLFPSNREAIADGLLHFLSTPYYFYMDLHPGGICMV